tara:strand:+ start:518 stop:748 length:231 start_codon:yes stop_codon:yes gene_type:complete
MIEAGVSIGIALFTGLAVLTNRLNSRIFEMDSRIDRVELRVAEKYVTRDELVKALDKMELHMVRIENKLDRISTER